MKAPILWRGWILVILTILAGVGVARGADLGGLSEVAKRDLEQALAQLSKAREEIEAERLPLSRDVSALEQQVIERRAEVQRAERFQENALVELNALKAQVRGRQDELKFVEALLAEYERAWRTRLHVSEEARFKPVLEELGRVGASPDLRPAEKLAGRLELLKVSIARLRGAAGGEVFDGRALAPDGRLVEGKVALVGPVGFFAGTGAGAASVVGLVRQELNRADPTVFEVPASFREGIESLATRGNGVMALDSTLGNAIKLASIKESFAEHAGKGGVVMFPILGLAGIAAIVAILKWVQLSRVRLASVSDLQVVLRHLNAGAVEKALGHARSIPGPAGELLATAVQHADEKKEYVEEVLYEKMLSAKPVLESFLPFIGLTAAAAPLLGLLGTVTGMITTFNMISIFGTGDPKTLSGGISEALITTEFGLYVAIPAVLAHAFLGRKAKGVLGSMEQTAVGFINGLPEKGVPVA